MSDLTLLPSFPQEAQDRDAVAVENIFKNLDWLLTLMDDSSEGGLSQFRELFTASKRLQTIIKSVFEIICISN